MERQGYKPPKGIHGVASMVLDLVPRSVGKFAEGVEGESWVGVADSPGPGVQEMMRAVGRYAPNTTDAIGGSQSAKRRTGILTASPAPLQPRAGRSMAVQALKLVTRGA